MKALTNKIHSLGIILLLCLAFFSCNNRNGFENSQPTIPEFPQNVKLGQTSSSVQSAMKPAYGDPYPYYGYGRLFSFCYEGNFHFDGYTYDQELMYFNEAGFLRGIRLTMKFQDQYQSRQMGQKLWNHYNKRYNIGELQYSGGVASTSSVMINTEEYGNIQFKLYVYAQKLFVEFMLS